MPSSSLVPDDPSVLLTTAGMQQFKRYYTGELDARNDFGALSTASIQKCFRTSDIDEVGDESHLTFFEMLGNFSFGGYFKKEAIEYAHEFITQELGLKIDYVSVFEGDKEVPSDKESEDIWKSLGIKNIKKAGRADNFWGPTGSEGPCGPTTEIYIDGTEIWNIVFNEYYMRPDKKLESLKQKGVDTGMGLERLAMVSQGVPTVFDTDLFRPFINSIQEDASENIISERVRFSGPGKALFTHDKFIVSDKDKRVIADHARGIIFLISDGVAPSNKDAGYILRRLMRRYIFRMYSLGSFEKLLEAMINYYGGFYKELNKEKIMLVFSNELEKFLKTLTIGLGELYKMEDVDAISAFNLYQSYGLPYEVIKDYAGEKAEKLNREDFDEKFKRHQEISKAGAEKKFGGHGLILNTGELKAGSEEELRKVLRLHTATHLLHQALREVLGPEVSQRGSDITAERTRFDFTFPRKVNSDELKKVEELANKIIEKDYEVKFEEMPKGEAEKTGALHFFKEKYPDVVKVYYITPRGGGIQEAFSKEFCGGPHVAHTGEIGKIKITKEEAVGAGVRRLRAIVEETIVSGIVAGKGSGKR